MNPSWRRLAAAGHERDEVAARAALSDHDAVARELGLGALHRMGALAETELRAALADPDERVRRRATLIVATVPGMSLTSMLRDPSTAVVEAAAWAAGEHESVDDDVLELLVELAGAATDPLVREAAVAALGAIGDPRGLPAILVGCADKPAIRRRAVLALAPFSGPEVDAALAAALEDRDWQVRQAAEDLVPFMEAAADDGS